MIILGQRLLLSATGNLMFPLRKSGRKRQEENLFSGWYPKVWNDIFMSTDSMAALKEKVLQWIDENITEKRKGHILRVSETAVQLAKIGRAHV